MPEEHVTTSQDPSGSGARADDASTRLATLEALVAQLQEGITKRDGALAKMQSEKDRTTEQLGRERKKREQLEASRVRDVSKLAPDAQTEYLKTVAAQEHVKATKFELAHQYELDPTELDGEYPSAEAMRLHAMELAQKKGSQTLATRLDQLTQVVETLAQAQVAQLEQQSQPLTVQPDLGGRHGASVPEGVLQEYDALIAQARKRGDHEAATRLALDKIHRDPSKIVGSATPTEAPPPGALAKSRR